MRLLLSALLQLLLRSWLAALLRFLLRSWLAALLRLLLRSWLAALLQLLLTSGFLLQFLLTAVVPELLHGRPLPMVLTTPHLVEPGSEH